MNILRSNFDLGRERTWRLWGAHFDFRGRQQGIYDGQCTRKRRLVVHRQICLPPPQGWWGFHGLTHTQCQEQSPGHVVGAAWELPRRRPCSCHCSHWCTGSGAEFGGCGIQHLGPLAIRLSELQFLHLKSKNDNSIWSATQGDAIMLTIKCVLG